MRNGPEAASRRRAILMLGGVGLLVGALIGPTGGCQEPQPAPGSLLIPFDVLGLMRKPVRVGETTLELMPPPLLLPKRHLFRDGLSQHLKEPVQFELMTPRQIRVHLGTGRMSFAMLRPQEYPEVAAGRCCEILAVPINSRGQTYRQGLIVVPPPSPVRTVSDIRGRRFHFMPLGDPLNDAAIGALADAGLSRGEIDKSLLGLGLDTTHINSLEVAKSVVLENGAGVIDEADYEKWPEKGGSFVLLSASKDQVRVVGKTIRVPEGPFVVSVNAPAELKEKVRQFLFEVAPNRFKLALAAMDLKGFAPPIDPKEYEAFSQLYRRVHPPSSQPAEPATAPE